MNLEPLQVVNLIKKFNNILILGHKNPDGDCLGSMAALRQFIVAQGQDALAWVGSLPKKYRFLAPAFTDSIPDNNAFDLVICVDTPCRSRLELSADLLPLNLPFLCLDHHPVTISDFDYYLMDKTQAAVGCIILDIIKAAAQTVDATMATGIYTAILTDTGSFTNRNTDLKVFGYAHEAVAAGADPAEIANYVYNSASALQLKLTGAALNSLQLLVDNQVALMSLSAQTKIDLMALKADTEDLITYARSIDGVRVAAVLIENDDAQSVKISLRSKTTSDDISILARKYGGGGHKCAAGATVNENLSTFLPKFKEELKSFTLSLIKE